MFKELMLKNRCAQAYVVLVGKIINKYYTWGCVICYNKSDVGSPKGIGEKQGPVSLSDPGFWSQVKTQAQMWRTAADVARNLFFFII